MENDKGVHTLVYDDGEQVAVEVQYPAFAALVEETVALFREHKAINFVSIDMTHNGVPYSATISRGDRMNPDQLLDLLRRTLEDIADGKAQSAAMEVAHAALKKAGYR